MSEAAPPDGYARSCIRWDGGWLQFDAVLAENILHPSDVTRFPVEPGAGPDLTDHVQLHPIEISLDALVTNHPSEQPLTHNDGIQAQPQDVTVTLKRPLIPNGLGPISGAGRQADALVRSATRGNVSLAREEVVKLNVNGYPGLQRVQNVYEELIAIRAKSRLLTVVIGQIAELDGCILENFERHRDNRWGPDAFMVTMNLVAMQFSTTQGEIRIREPAEPRGQTKKAGGRQQGEKAKAKDQAQAQDFFYSMGLAQ